MREILDVILEEKIEFDKERILFSKDNAFLDKLELMLSYGENCEGSFVIRVPEERYTYGYVSASDARMDCITKGFSGTEEIHFCFRGEHMEKGEVCRGEFLVRCNRGEFMLPFEVRVQEEELLSSQGPIRNLIHFSNLAKANWQEAVSIFYSSRFEEMIREKEPQLYLCYKGLSAMKRNEHNMDQFLIAAGKKQRMGYFVEDSLLAVENPVEVWVLSLGIVRNGWGYTRLDVKTEGDFVFVEKVTITDDDFLGNRYKLSVYIDSERLHAGRNFGRVILWDNDISVEVPVEVYSSGQVIPGRDIRREKRRNNCKLTDIYQAFRLKEMNTAGWLKETDQLVQRMMSLDEKDMTAKLYFAQILMTAERYNEAGWILEHVGDGLEEGLEDTPELEAYYLYLMSLLRRDEAYTRQVANQIARIYKEQGESWRVAWLLLYVSQEYERSITGKWLFLEEQFEQGCRSPIIYFEAVQLLNRNPALLRKIERFELQVLYYGNKKGILSPELLEQVYYLSGKVKEFSNLLYRILENCYEKTQDERIVKEICTLLIKGNRVEKKYYDWFKLGIEAGIRITNLYEYYMMSLDLDKEEEIPKIVLLYFTYQSNLSHAHAAYLYRYVIRKKEEYPDIFESYRNRISGFVKEQVQRERMSEHLDSIYHVFLTEDMVQRQNAAAILRILFSYQIKASNSMVKKAYVYQKGCVVPQVYPVTDESTWIPVYGRESCVVWEDFNGNRFLAGYPLGINHELADHPIVKRGAGYIEDNPFLDLYLYEAREMVYEANAELIGRLFRLWEDDRFSPEVRREAAVRIMKYYYHTEDKPHLSAYLETLPMNLLTRREASEAIKYMVFCRMDDLAYEWMNQFSPVLVDSKISASLLSAMIKKRESVADVRLLSYAFETFEKGKYTNEILRYLAMYYEGTAHDMYQIWKAALACGIDVRELSERLLIQMLFTESFVQEHGEVFKKYLKDAPEESVVCAYLIRRSYAYYLEGKSLNGVAAERILQMYGQECGLTADGATPVSGGRLISSGVPASSERSESHELPIICELACLKYFADARIQPDERQDALLTQLLKKQLQNGIHLPWFMYYSKSEVDCSYLMDKTILEYHAKNDGVVKFRFLPLHENFEESSWKIVNMYPVCRRVFFTEQVLFFGESLQYEILEEVDGSDVVMKSGVLKKDEDDETHLHGRFHAINTLLEAKALHREKQFEGLLEDYLKKDFINEHIFMLMQ